MRKRHDLSLAEKLVVLKKYDDLPEMSQWQTDCKLNMCQNILNMMLKSRQEIETALLTNESLDRKRKRADKEEELKRLWNSGSQS